MAEKDIKNLAICGILRNPPAFSKPDYSDSYLPAAMQVIFYAVEQLKLLRSEEAMQSSTFTESPSTSPISFIAEDQQTVSQDPSTICSIAITQSLDESKGEEDESKSENSSNDKTGVSVIKETSKNKTEDSAVEVEQTTNDKMEEPSAEKTQEGETGESNAQETEKDKVEGSKVEEAFDDQTEESKTQETSTDEMDESKTQEDASKDRTGDSRVEESSKDSAETLVALETSKPGEIDQQSMEDPSAQPESPEVNEETPESNYATPETNYEEPERVHVMQETNQEVPEENHEWISWSPTSTETKLETTTASSDPDGSTRPESIVENVDKKKEPTIDSVVQDVYQILKPKPSKFADADHFEESKSVAGIPVEKMENAEEEDDETRFTRLGEKVTQVPRPSLSSYLRRSKVPPSATLQQLANLYDSLSKDARKQGFGKYTGFSDDVLNTLQSSAEGGIGPQLKKILSKLLERNELTREDARMRTSLAVRDLDNPSSMLNKDLRPLLPLRYSP
ncbi:microtubule-associated protein futsch isoform X2 [Bombus pyrosoma]|uniref:microtubule-associated protein futsch isoform X2 n=1 Tax=Bombus pyrosoma TaxID=396416 RepID=UPI001CB99988|nr:microtubule-associated protein futsch isoform X2 [Bombus pyrosoma]